MMTLTDRAILAAHAYDYAHSMLYTGSRTEGLFDITHEKCLDWAMWVTENYPDGDCDYSLHFQNWLRGE